MAQRDKESLKEYAERWRQITAHVLPPMGEQQMTKVFLKTLGSFYCERMIASAPNDFTEMVIMGVCLEEDVREGRLTKDEGSSGTKKSSYEISKKKESETNDVAKERRVRPPKISHQHQQQVSSVTLVVNVAPTVISYQRAPQQGNQGQGQKI